ncbi:sulfite exporter TauE/SafE family protein [Prodigiosinella confusarubida]|uniref:Probable membrane transporter protein n=1 Tax=Serratia sp. (strain ATCC 39006) TaxID=104623 RepID=E7BBJ3_SERS3|nr:sulfite exporter TauE/SafE family protein [Serratia sp. ATCC 39006]AUH02000.1 sulfite exporter TauE/SafE family protein [Serratia sp. ATCC 39006]AUH06322.1 sulfite exporter TauE/SafE family protein [Serratia sp. ATCC 39006]CBY83979.1 DUF81-family membrane protein [Serratia sp. ATCC 39006]
MFISLVLGLCVGAILGITGAGGGIFAVPALVIGMGWSLPQAAPVALVAVAGSAALGAVEAWRKNLVRYRAAIVMALAGIPVTAAGAFVAHHTSPTLLTLLFAAVMIVVAVRLLRSQHKKTTTDTQEITTYRVVLDEHTERFVWTMWTWLLFLSFGAITGFMTGLLAVGGGFIIVPLLRQFTPLTIHGCIATSLLVIALVSSGGIVTTVMHGASLPLPMTVWFALSTAAGMFIGRKIGNYLPDHIAQLSFAGLLIIVALGMAINATIVRFAA